MAYWLNIKWNNIRPDFQGSVDGSSFKAYRKRSLESDMNIED